MTLTLVMTLANNQQPIILAALAIAYAAARRFDQAEAAAQSAMKLASTAKDDPLSATSQWR